MLSFLRFLFSKHFWLNLVVMGIFSLFLVWLAFSSMNWYTHHGESITVPDLKNFTVDKANNLLQSKDLRYTILDSTFVDDLPKGTIIEQNPKPGEKVKEKRRIYLTISSKTPPPVSIPNIIFASRRNAEEQLQSVGLNVGELEYVPDRAKDAVLQIKYNDKKYNREDLDKGIEVPKGTPITLILGDGVGHTRIEVPALVGLSFLEAKLALRAWSLNQGHITRGTGINNNNIDQARVWKQYPKASAKQEITIGEPIDLWLTLGDVARPKGSEDAFIPPPPPPSEETTPAETEGTAVDDEEEVIEEETVETTPIMEEEIAPITEVEEPAIVQPAPPPIRNINPPRPITPPRPSPPITQPIRQPRTQPVETMPVSPPVITAEPTPPITRPSTPPPPPEPVSSVGQPTTTTEPPSTPQVNPTPTPPAPTPTTQPTGGFKVIRPKLPTTTPTTPPPATEQPPATTPTFKVIRPDTSKSE